MADQMLLSCGVPSSKRPKLDSSSSDTSGELPVGPVGGPWVARALHGGIPPARSGSLARWCEPQGMIVAVCWVQKALLGVASV